LHSPRTATATLTSNTAVDGGASWSPDGSKIVFQSTRDGGDYEIYVMDANGANQTRLTSEAGIDALGDWSPDGSKLLFYSERDGNREIYVMDADGSNQVRLTNDAGIDMEAEWSPDGSSILFSSDRDGNYDIYSASVIYENTFAITVTAVNDAPVITSDGGGATASINVAENTTAVTTVTSTDVDGGTPVYSISSGADAALFSIDANSGALTFNSAPNFEAPADANTDNVYEVTVQASDGNGGLTTQAISVTVTDQIELVVSNTNATGTGSLYEAILNANANVGVTDTITFNISEPLVSGMHTIAVPPTGLPAITDTIVIDGTTDSDYSGDPVIRIDGAGVNAGIDGLKFANGSDGSAVRGLIITNFTRNGIQIDSGADGVSITNNWIGTTGNGTSGDGNSNNGINVQGANTVIGGTGVNDGNVITNSGNEGINLTGTGATGTVIQGNIIGLDPDGSTGSGNTDVGIAVLSGAHNTTIGGTDPQARNIATSSR
jgi:hypothetical protein